MGETPGEGFPQTPFLRLMSNKNFARFFVKKRGKKLLNLLIWRLV